MHHPGRRAALRTLLLALSVPALTAAPRPVAAGSPALALEGYDPVAYFTVGRAERGRPDIELEWDEHRYRFTSAAHRERFRADPLRYAPQFASLCAMALSRGQALAANPEYWLINDGKLYLFARPLGPELFQKDAARSHADAARNAGLVERR